MFLSNIGKAGNLSSCSGKLEKDLARGTLTLFWFPYAKYIIAAEAGKTEICSFIIFSSFISLKKLIINTSAQRFQRFQPLKTRIVLKAQAERLQHWHEKQITILVSRCYFALESDVLCNLNDL